MMTVKSCQLHIKGITTLCLLTMQSIEGVLMDLTNGLYAPHKRILLRQHFDTQVACLVKCLDYGKVWSCVLIHCGSIFHK